MTLLSMCNSVLSTNGFPEFETIINNSNPGAKQILALARRGLQITSEDYEWPQLLTVGSVVANESSSELLPVDFRQMAVETLYNTTPSNSKIGGAMTPKQFMDLQYGNYPKLYKENYRLEYIATGQQWALRFLVDTVEGDVYQFLYYRNTYASTEAAEPVSNYTNDDDICTIPETVMEMCLNWRFRRVKGLDYSTELAEFNAVMPNRLAADLALPSIPVGGVPYGDPYLGFNNIPEDGYGV